MTENTRGTHAGLPATTSSSVTWLLIGSAAAIACPAIPSRTQAAPPLDASHAGGPWFNPKDAHRPTSLAGSRSLRAPLPSTAAAQATGSSRLAGTATTIAPVRKRQFPIVGDGGGIWSWIHLDDAAAATVLALEHDGPGIYNIVDDEPAAVREWLPVLAASLGAKPPRRFPTWLARMLAGETVTVMSTEARGASNAKAKRELGWTPRYPTWRTGFKAVYSALSVADRPSPRPASRTSHSST